jgi:antitoxin HicB
MLTYWVDLTPDDNGTLLVTSPAFPEVTTFGEDEEAARRAAVSAIEEAIAARISDGDPVPLGRKGSGTPVLMPTMTTLKVLLYDALRKTGVSRAELARRLGWHREQVDRLFRLDHASRLDQLDAAFRALQRTIDVEIKACA